MKAMQTLSSTNYALGVLSGITIILSLLLCLQLIGTISQSDKIAATDNFHGKTKVVKTNNRRRFF